MRILLIIALILLPQLANATITDYVSRWNFEAQDGTDETGANNGTLVGSPTFTTGKIGAYAISLDGTSQNVSLPDNASLMPAAFTIGMWVYDTDTPPTVSSRHMICLHQNDVCIRIQDSGTVLTPTFLVYNGGFTTLSCTTNITGAAWQHVAVTFDGSTLRCYVQGVAAGNTAGTLGWEGGSTLPSIGSLVDAGGQKWEGYLDDVRFYNRALDSSEVTELFNFTGTAAAQTTQNPVLKLLNSLILRGKLLIR